MIILASNSIKRKEILKELNLDFSVIVSSFDELSVTDLNPDERVKKIAFGKACKVYDENKDATIIAADTLVYFNNKFYGKPKDEKDAFKMLKSFSNNFHEVYTGVCIIHDRKMHIFSDRSKVYFKNLSDEKINEYIKSGESLGRAGSYEIQGKAKEFLNFLDGDIYSVSGLPKEKVYKKLIEIGAVKSWKN